MTPTVRGPHASPGRKKSVLFLKFGGKHTGKEIRDLTGVPEKTQRRWVADCKAAGDWNLVTLKPAQRKRRSDAGAGRKLTNRMIAAIKSRLHNNPQMTVKELGEEESLGQQAQDLEQEEADEYPLL